VAIPYYFCTLLKLRGEGEDRFIVLEVESMLSRDHQQNLKYSVSEAKARELLKTIGFTDSEVEATVSGCLCGPYYDERGAWSHKRT
jgi:hypothetical protein